MLKFSLNNFKEIELSDVEKSVIEDDKEFFDSSFLDGGTGLCSCDNFVLEAHYVVEFENNPALANSFFIKNVFVDAVFGY